MRLLEIIIGLTLLLGAILISGGIYLLLLTRDRVVRWLK